MKDNPRNRRSSEALHQVARGRRSPLAQLKAQALGASASARNAPVADVRDAFGFMPVGIQGVVIRWPTL